MVTTKLEIEHSIATAVLDGESTCVKKQGAIAKVSIVQWERAACPSIAERVTE